MEVDFERELEQDGRTLNDEVFEMNFVKGDVVKWTGEDEQGPFVYEGVMKKTFGEHYVFWVPEIGEMKVLKDDGIFEKSRRQINIPAVKAEPKPVEKVKVLTRGESKLAKAKELYMNSSDKSRKSIIALFVKELGLSEACSSTYHATCRKVFVEE